MRVGTWSDLIRSSDWHVIGLQAKSLFTFILVLSLFKKLFPKKTSSKTPSHVSCVAVSVSAYSLARSRSVLLALFAARSLCCSDRSVCCYSRSVCSLSSLMLTLFVARSHLHRRVLLARSLTFISPTLRTPTQRWLQTVWSVNLYCQRPWVPLFPAPKEGCGSMRLRIAMFSSTPRT